MDAKNYHEDLSHIRSMMERSSRFISLSGLSGVVAGIAALLGAGYAYFAMESKKWNTLTETDLALRRHWCRN